MNKKTIMKKACGKGGLIIDAAVSGFKKAYDNSKEQDKRDMSGIDNSKDIVGNLKAGLKGTVMGTVRGVQKAAETVSPVVKSIGKSAGLLKGAIKKARPTILPPVKASPIGLRGTAAPRYDEIQKGNNGTPGMWNEGTGKINPSLGEKFRDRLPLRKAPKTLPINPLKKKNIIKRALV